MNSKFLTVVQRPQYPAVGTRAISLARGRDSAARNCVTETSNTFSNEIRVYLQRDTLLTLETRFLRQVRKSCPSFQFFQSSPLIFLPSFPCSRYCFQKMAATKQESKSITLKGSAELVTEFFGNFRLHVDFLIRLVLFWIYFDLFLFVSLAEYGINK